MQMFADDEHLGTLELTYTIDGVTTIFKKDGGTVNVSDEVY
jgi:hypothetical protein